jgi:hypothetical protein
MELISPLLFSRISTTRPCWAKWTQSTPSYPVSRRSMSVLSSIQNLCLWSGLFLWGCVNKILDAVLIFPLCLTLSILLDYGLNSSKHFPNVISLHFIMNIIFIISKYLNYATYAEDLLATYTVILFFLQVITHDHVAYRISNALLYAIFFSVTTKSHVYDSLTVSSNSYVGHGNPPPPLHADINHIVFSHRLSGQMWATRN